MRRKKVLALSALFFSILTAEVVASPEPAMMVWQGGGPGEHLGSDLSALEACKACCLLEVLCNELCRLSVFLYTC